MKRHRTMMLLFLFPCLLFLPSCDDNCCCRPVHYSLFADIPYNAIEGVDPNLLSLDIYVPFGNYTEPMPVVMYIHGGSWYESDKQGDVPIKQNMDFKARAFTDAGFVFISINHRLSPFPISDDPNRIMHPVHVQDVASAIGWIHEHIGRYGGDHDRIGLLGWSSGGHLSALVATDETYLEEVGLSLEVITCTGSLNSAALDIPTTIANSSDERNAKYFNAFGNDPLVWQDASPLYHVQPDKGIPPFLLVHEDNNLTNQIQATFYDALSDAGIPIDHYYAKGLEHREINWLIGIDETLTAAILDFFLKWLS